MSFAIQITNIPMPDLEPGEKAVYGEITIVDFHERFYASLEYWTSQDYSRQWMYALERLLGGQDQGRAALITDMHDPLIANFITCWTLYREGNKVYVHNQLLFLDELPHPFRIEEVNSYIGPRETTSDDGGKISEWNSSVEDLKVWLSKLKDSQQIRT